MKIQNDGLPGSAPLETPRTQPAPGDVTSNAIAGQGVGGHDGDSVEISGISTRVADANSTDTQQRANRVAELTALHARGGYQVNSTNLSSSLITQAATPGGEA